MPAYKNVKYKGFTLVELLVVITIIAILSLIGLTLFTTVQRGARDAKRRGDVNAISKALEVHYGNGIYESAVKEWFVGSTVPVDPQGSYYYWNGIQDTTKETPTYTICAKLENKNGNSKDKGNGTVFNHSDITENVPNGYYCAKNVQ